MIIRPSATIGFIALTTAFLLSAQVALAQGAGNLPASLIAPDAVLSRVSGEYSFTEGPAVAADGSVFFTDIPPNRIYRWSPDGTVTLFRENTNGTNGLFFDSLGNLVACESGTGRIVCIDPSGQLTVLADGYEGKRFNAPNDVWVAPDDGVYFSDPLYSRGERAQGGEHVYYIAPDRSRVIRIIDDMVKPNGLIGTPDGTLLYVTDPGAGKTYRYAIGENGALTDKTLFCEVGGDGMTIDASGKVYIASTDILIFDPSRAQIGIIDIPERPTNITFAGPGRDMLFITARTAVYTLKMAVTGAQSPSTTGE